jgi:hypothetical protein
LYFLVPYFCPVVEVVGILNFSQKTSPARVRSHQKKQILALLEVRYIKDMNVYIVTALISLFAYLWLGAPALPEALVVRRFSPWFNQLGDPS